MARHIHSKRTQIGFIGVTVFFLLIGLYWFFATVIPVALVEAKYQYHATLQNLFGVSDLRALIIPDFQPMFDLGGRSKYKEYGITIPALYLDEPVIFNVDPNDEKAYKAALMKGIAHASGTAFPDAPGLGYYFAHSSEANVRNQYNAVFYLLGKLKVNDDVYIWHENQKFHYQVTETKITSPQDVSFLQQEPDGEEIVLQTCWPPGTTQQRLLVFARRI